MGRYFLDLIRSGSAVSYTRVCELRSFWLGAMPSFWAGYGSTIDLGGTLLTQYNFSNSPEQADARALYSDWKLVGVDLDRAVLQYRPTECAQTRHRAAR